MGFNQEIKNRTTKSNVTNIKLVLMPFAPLHYPSIALTQLKYVLHEKFGNRIKVDIHYLNHDFGEFFGVDIYQEGFCDSDESADHSSVEWLFRASAFPDLPDNRQELLDNIDDEERDEYINFYESYLKKLHLKIPDFIKHLVSKYKLDRADIVGFSSMFSQNLPSIAMSKEIRKRNSEIFQIMGGANCEFPMGVELVQQFDCFDAIASGHSLVSFPELVKSFVAGDYNKIDHINGIFTKSNCISSKELPISSKSRNNPVVLLKNNIKQTGDERPLDDIVELDYEDYFNSLDSFFKNHAFKILIPFETSRGCWWGAKVQCTFCGLNSSSINYRFMNSKLAISYINGLLKKYAHRVDHLESIDNALPANYPLDVMPFINPPEDTNFYWEVRPELSLDDLKLLAKANVIDIQPGIESLNTNSLKLMNKGTTAFSNIRLLRDAIDCRVNIMWYLMLGFPGETEDVLQKYLTDFVSLYHLKPPITIMEVEFHRYSKYFNEQKKYGLKLKPDIMYHYMYPFKNEILMNIAYYFEDIAGAVNENCQIDSELGEEVEELVEVWRKRFNGQDGSLKASLHFKEASNENTVVDTRSGQLLEFELDEVQFNILQLLKHPYCISAIKKNLIVYESKEIEVALKQLHHSLKFLFEENDTYISLVNQTNRL